MKRYTPDPPELIKNRRELVEEMEDEHGFIFCQVCEQNRCGNKFHVHHIVFRSEAPDHPMLHEKVNLLIVGSWCHMDAPDSLHNKKSRRNKIMKERGLDEIFGIVIDE